MTWRRGALILSVYLVLAAALTGAVLHVATGGRTVPADLSPEPEHRATVEILVGAPKPGRSAGHSPADRRAEDVVPGPGRAARPLPPDRLAGSGTTALRAGPRAPTAPAGADRTPDRSPQPGARPVPAAPPRPGPRPTPGPAPVPPPAPIPTFDPVGVSAPTTTLRSVEGAGRAGSTQHLLLDFAVDEPSGPGAPSERSVRLPMTVTPPADATALRFDVALDLSEGSQARVTVAPVGGAPSRPTVDRGASGTHAIVVPLPLNGVLAPFAAAAGPFTSTPATIAVPFAAG